MRKDFWANLPKDILLVGVLSVGMGTAASVVFPGGGLGTPLLGSTAGALIGTAVFSKQKEQELKRSLQDFQAQKDKDYQLSLQDLSKRKDQECQFRLQALEKQLDTQRNWQEYQTKLIRLKDQVESLEEKQTNLGEVEGKLTQKQSELQEVQERLTRLNQEKQDLENRVNTLRQNPPNLSELEQLNTQLGQLRVEKSQLEGQITALQSQNQNLQEVERSLRELQANYIVKNVELQQLIADIAKKQEETKNLEQRTVELELIRATYDSLSLEKQQSQTRINQLSPEIDRLEAEKQRILQAIQNHTLDYQQIERDRQRIRNLTFELREKESQKRELEQIVQELEGQQSVVLGKIEALKAEKEELQEEINLMKNQIDSMENTADFALRSLEDHLWTPNSNSEWNPPENIFLDAFIQDLKDKGLAFPRRVVYAFHTSLKVQDISALVILAGISGTGKSELPQRYADFIGAQRLTLAVQPRWDSPQDLQGFYNYVEKKFKPTDLIRGIYQYNHDPVMNNRIVLVLLDEMNLARVEYYFSDFLSKLESRRSSPTFLELDVGSLQIPEAQRKLKIPKQFLFVGTMNEDETTQTLSDKVLDRANVLTFGKPKTLQLRKKRTTEDPRSMYVSYSRFEQWFKTPDQSSEVVEKVKDYLDKANNIMESIGHPFAHRVYQAITQYVINYPGVSDSNSDEFRFALVDQFAQKLLPKLRGLMIDDYQEELNKLASLIEQLGDVSLIEAFKKAKNSRSRQFEWKGLIYPEEE
ncbi:AAA family ATPase [Planktothrix agardhii]|uniref:AAA family ATPase n=2 Tax=Planktothrix agardhii TaxID=1160 RepID=UPI001F2EF16B|nr:AAA family ATPase [Planktothrix agardhii]MCF3574646.1 AAA family ATPase [Planktothrix agardhii 1812]MCF3581476.1 AAA family ATPase [Planktothrix agardhii 1811]